MTLQKYQISNYEYINRYYFNIFIINYTYYEIIFALTEMN